MIVQLWWCRGTRALQILSLPFTPWFGANYTISPCLNLLILLWSEKHSFDDSIKLNYYITVNITFLSSLVKAWKQLYQRIPFTSSQKCVLARLRWGDRSCPRATLLDFVSKKAFRYKLTKHKNSDNGLFVLKDGFFRFKVTGNRILFLIPRTR